MSSAQNNAFRGWILCASLALAGGAFSESPMMSEEDAACALVDYFEAMSVPEPLQVLSGEALERHHGDLRKRLLNDVSLDPLPEKIDLDVHRSEPLDHPWCTIEKIEYQLWPGVYTEALLFTPKTFQETPASAVLCPHGHWKHNYAYPDVQKRMLVFAQMGYVVLSPRQNHHEDLPLGLSHQTLMIWTNMRGLDFLQSLPGVDPERIGVAGASGGGLQTQMLAALDDRVKAAVIVGLTCDFREIMFPHAAHCGCNHWPNPMTYTDGPEISALAWPRPVQYLVMNDWTRHFPYDNFPAIQALYRGTGVSERVSCTYWPTGHVYDRQKRERTYWWMERWLRQEGNIHTSIPEEPEEVTTIFPPEILDGWPVRNTNNKGFNALSEHFREQWHYGRNPLPAPTDLKAYQARMRGVLPGLLGMDNGLAPPDGDIEVMASVEEGSIVLSRVFFPSEGGLRIPALLLFPTAADASPCPITILLNRHGMALFETTASLVERVERGEVIVIPDIRFSGVYDLENLAGIIAPDLVHYAIASTMPAYTSSDDQRKYLLWAWERNSIVWGRSLVTMALADIQNIVQAVRRDPRIRKDAINIETRGAAHLALAAIFAAIMDSGITGVDVDICGARYDAYQYWFEKPDGLPVIPSILRHGDVPQWLALLTDRSVKVRNLNARETEAVWLRELFAAEANAEGLCME